MIRFCRKLPFIMGLGRKEIDIVFCSHTHPHTPIRTQTNLYGRAQRRTHFRTSFLRLKTTNDRRSSTVLQKKKETKKQKETDYVFCWNKIIQIFLFFFVLLIYWQHRCSYLHIVCRWWFSVRLVRNNIIKWDFQFRAMMIYSIFKSFF